MSAARLSPPTQRDVARAAGVSVATVSYVLSGRRNRGRSSSPEVVDRVQQAADELGYRPGRAGRTLRSGRTRLLAVASGTPLGPWKLGVIEQADEVAQEFGCHSVVLTHTFGRESLGRMTQLLADGLVDAVIALPSDYFDISEIRAVARTGLPVLTVGDVRRQGFDLIKQHHDEVVNEAVAHLVARGVQRAVCFHDEQPSGRVRLIERTLAEAGVEVLPSLAAPIPDPGVGELTLVDHALDFLRLHGDQVDAVMATSDRAAAAMVLAANVTGVVVPDRLKVIGMGNVLLGRSIAPRLTTMGVEDVDYRPAIRHLLRRVADPGLPPSTFHIPWQLIVRDSA